MGERKDEEGSDGGSPAARGCDAAAARPMLRNQTRRVSPADQALMNLRQLEMTPFLSAPSRMVLTEARFHMQGIASRTARLRRWL